MPSPLYDRVQGVGRIEGVTCKCEFEAGRGGSSSERPFAEKRGCGEKEHFMHELGVTESIAGIVLRHANMNGARRVLKVNIKLGELTGIVDRYVSFYWDMVTKDTVAQGAELNFVKVPTVAYCNRCREEFRIEEYDLTCPRCGEVASDIISGREFVVESIEIE